MKDHLKKRIAVTIAVMVCAILFTGCAEKTIRGEVTDVMTDPDTGVFSFVLMQDGNDPITVTTNKNTHIFSWIEEVSEADLKNGSVEGIMVSVTGTASGSSMAATEVEIDQLLTRNAYTLKDGTQIDTFVGLNDTKYCLADGTELLMVKTPIGPENVSVAGVESLDGLSEETQQIIVEYYDAQGILYDEFETLENAYDAYCIQKDDFSAYFLSQEIVPTASNEQIIYFLTVVTLPDNGSHGHVELRLGAAFDKETGEEIPTVDLFTCEPEDIILRLAAICGVDDNALIDEMKAKFQPEYVSFFPDNMEVTFPAGVLTECGTSYGMGFDYNEEVCTILQPWAIPDESRTE